MKLAVVRHDRLNQWDIGTFAGLPALGVEVFACGTKPVEVPGVRSFVYVRPWEVLELEPDVIDVPDPHYAFSQYFCDRFERVVITAWDNLPGKNHDADSKRAMRKAWKFVARTRMIRDALIWDGVPQDKISVVPAAVDTELFRPLPLEEREDAVLFCGRVVMEKGLLDLIWAMKGIAAELWVAGEPDQQARDFYDRWAFQAAERVPGGEILLDPVRIKWLGFLERKTLAATMARAKVFSCPSYPLGSQDPYGAWLEQFGQVYIEAMACGTPVVTTDCGGPSEILADGRYAWLVPARHWHELRKGIKTLLEHEAVWRRFSATAREQCEKRFSIASVAKRLKEVYFG